MQSDITDPTVIYVWHFQVTLLIPWLNQEDQALVFHGKHSFDEPEQQTECIQEWICKRTGFEAQFKIQYYPGRYDTRLLGIFPVGDLTVYIPVEEVSTIGISFERLQKAHSCPCCQLWCSFQQVIHANSAACVWPIERNWCVANNRCAHNFMPECILYWQEKVQLVFVSGRCGHLG